MVDYGEPYQSPDGSLVEHQQVEDSENGVENGFVSQQTAIHLAIVNQHEDVVEAFIEHKGVNKLYLVELVLSGL